MSVQVIAVRVIFSVVPLLWVKAPDSLPDDIVTGPVMLPADDNGLTVTTRVATADPQPLVTVKVIVSTPAVTPVTMPPVTVASPLVAPHVPPGARSVNVIVEPMQTVLLAPNIVPAVR